MNRRAGVTADESALGWYPDLLGMQAAGGFMPGRKMNSIQPSAALSSGDAGGEGERMRERDYVGTGRDQ
jgi:hypothetical protein